jgi:TldD protein
VRELLLQLVDSARGRSSYAEARFVSTRDEALGLRNGELVTLDSHEEEGIGVRVRVDGAWGFAAARGTERAAAEDALVRALALAESAPASRDGPLTEEPPAVGSYSSPVAIDPFDVSLEDKLAVLGEAEQLLRDQRGITVARASMLARREEKLFVSSEGSDCRQVLTECGGGISALASGDEEAQVRSYPGSHSGSVAQAGWEHVLGLDLAANAPRLAAEAMELLDAPPCPVGANTLVLAREQLGLQLHESVGHAVELDRILGDEASYAGTSWVPSDGAGALGYGSELMNVTADATLAGGLGSFRWDDEGVEARSLPIVREGVLAGFLSSRESAAEIGLARSGGCMRAESFARQPIVRMTNVSLEPGDAGTLENLIASTEKGIYIDTNRSWSIDSRRLHFQFGGEAAWEIVDGRLGRILRDPVYAGVTPEFWASLDAVCSPSEWCVATVTNCGKGEPGQFARVSHGCAPARFRNVQVGLE